MKTLASKQIRVYMIKVGRNTCVFDNLKDFYDELRNIKKENPDLMFEIGTKLMRETEFNDLKEYDGY